MVKSYDYIVIGGGSGGIASANRAAMYGAKTLLIEAKAIGGTCVNLGCVPKKVMWYGSQVKETLDSYASEYGFDVTINHFEFATLKANRQSYIERIHQSYERGFKSNHVDYVLGYANFVDNHSVTVNGEIYKAPHILIATGGHATIPDIPGSEYGMTSDGFFELDELPKRIAVVGGGYIAVELSGILHSMGVETHFFFRKDRFLRQFDNEIVDVLMETMSTNGPKLHPLSIPKEIIKNEDETLTLVLENDDRYTVDSLIWAIGRRPNVSHFGLENTDVSLDERGFIATDAFENTTSQGIYAVGDVNGKIALTPVAVKAGRQLAERLFNGKTDAKMDYDNVATVIFSHPVIGSIGLSEQQAIRQYGNEQITIYRSRFTPMYTALDQHRQPSLMKLVTLKDSGKIIGLHGIGYGVDEMIQGFSVAIKMGATKEDFDNTVAIHPTGSEEFVTMR